MQQGYPRLLILEVQAPVVNFGGSGLAFAAENAPGSTSVCESSETLPLGKTVNVAGCLCPLHRRPYWLSPRTIPTVVAPAIFRKRLPQYRWHGGSGEGTNGRG